ncbi:MAG: LamG domain-containing protein [bacterium]|nr:LamG domain-containing protein [bacterium]
MKLTPFSLLVLTAPAFPQTLVAHFRLDEASGEAFDASGAGHDAAWLGGATQGVPGAHAATGLGAQLDGVDARAGLMNNTVLDPLTSDFTVLAWINLDTTNGFQRIFGGDPGWGFGFVNNQILLTTYGVQDFVGPTAAQTGAWMHVAVVFDASFLATYYVDGAAIGSVVGTGPSNAPGPNWWIGSKQGNTEYWQGAIDDVQVYQGSLSAVQVGQLFSAPGSTLEVGTSYCGPSLPHSGGQSAWIGASGGTYPGGLLALDAVSLPPNQFGYFIFSQTQGFTAGFGGSSGVLCLDTSYGGFRAPGQIALSGPGGAIGIEIDTTTLPMPTPVTVQSGQTWHFQAWFRDSNPAPTSNFTNGLSLTFQ